MRVINLNENLQYGTIYYHSVFPEVALNIVQSNCLVGSYMDFSKPTVSLSRNPRLHYAVEKSGGGFDVTFALDMHKLSNKGYALKQFDYFYDKELDDYPEGDSRRRSESEEVLVLPKGGVHDINLYIIGAYIDDLFLRPDVIDDPNHPAVVQFLKHMPKYSSIETIRDYIEIFKRNHVDVYPESDLHKLHSYRVKQLDKKRSVPDYKYYED